MQAVKRLWGQITLGAALSMAAALLAVGTTVWAAASNYGAQTQQQAAMESRVERLESAVVKLRDLMDERLPKRR